MIKVGELKIGDRVLDKLNNKFGTVIDIEYRLIDDESELITIEHDGLNTLALIRTPFKEDFIEKIKNEKENKMKQEIKDNTKYRFRTEEDYLDFLKTAEQQGYKWDSEDKPTQLADKYKNYAKIMYINTGYGRLTYATYIDERRTQVEYWARKEEEKNKGDKKMTQEEFDIYYMGKFPRKEYKIIFNDPATILFVNGKKYVAKAHDEEFDCEKGALVCLMKSFGISHLDLKRMIKNAKVQSKGKKTSTNKEEIYVNGEKFEQPELDSEREKLYKDIPQRNSEDYMTKIPFHFDVPTSDIDSGFKVPMVEEKVVVSPKGKKRGQPYKFFAGDKVIVRDCSYYKYTTNANAKQLLNKVWEIAQDNSDFAGSLYVINGVEFAGSELEPVKD